MKTDELGPVFDSPRKKPTTPRQRRGEGTTLSHTFDSLEARLTKLEESQERLADVIEQLVEAIQAGDIVTYREDPQREAYPCWDC